MNRIRPITHPAPVSAVSIEGIQEVVSVLRSIIALLQEAHDVLGFPLPRKEG